MGICKSCCCLCCPMGRCALWFCAVELGISLYLWLHMVNFLAKTFSVFQWKDLIIVLFLGGWLISLLTSTFTMVVASRKKNSDYILPRIVQLAGFLALGLLAIILLAVYFSGASYTVNNWFTWLYETLYLEEPMDVQERRRFGDSVKYYMMACIPIVFCFICYMGVALAVTRRYRHNMIREYGRGGNGANNNHFQLVAQQEPLATTTNTIPATAEAGGRSYPPPYNPDGYYHQAIPKVVEEEPLCVKRDMR